MIKCKYCGCKVSAKDIHCPNCGAPVTDDEDEQTKTEDKKVEFATNESVKLSSKKPEKKNRALIWGVVSIITCWIALGFFFGIVGLVIGFKDLKKPTVDKKKTLIGIGFSGLSIVLAVVMSFVITNNTNSSANTTKTKEVVVSEEVEEDSDQNDTSDSKDAEEVTDSLYANVEVRDVMNGTKTEKVGEMSVVFADEADCTEENLADYYYNYVKKNPDNNFNIIIFNDSDPLEGVYAVDGLVEVGALFEGDGNIYMLAGDADDAVYYTGSDDGKTLTPIYDDDTEIDIAAGELGEYGQELVLNAGTDSEDKTIGYFVPAGTYEITNIGDTMSQANVYKNEKVTTDEGWEEWADGQSELIDVNETVEMTIEDGYFFNCDEPSHFSLKKVD